MYLCNPMKNIFVCLFSLCWLPVFAQGADNDIVKDEQIVREYLALTDMNDSSASLMQKSAMLLINTPYVGHTLEGNATEQLVVNLRELDCLTFVENCLALSRAAQVPTPDFKEFTRQLQLIRYREGRIDGYPSRLHYTTDWITDNVAKGTVEDITSEIGGKPLVPNVHFMSTHPDNYAALKNNPQDVSTMRMIETEINARTSYSYIPKNQIAKNQSLIQSGDIICFTTSLPGLDISHVAIAYRRNDGQLTFIHASTQFHKVVVQPGTLVNYCKSILSNTGIMVLRPIYNS